MQIEYPLLFKTFTSRGDKNTINVSAPIQAPSSGERESRDENDNYNRVMECLKRNDDIVDVNNVMSSNICIPYMPDSLFIISSWCFVCQDSRYSLG